MRDSAKRPTAATNHRLKQSGALAIAALLATAIAVATAFADKEVVDYFGTASGSGSKGGEFNNPRDIGLNRTGAGPADAGDIYVADDNNHRVQRFDSEGNFISAWGADVSLPDGGTDFEICTVASECQAAANSGGNGTTAGNGTLDNPQSVAVDNDTGNVYVSDRDNRRVNVYDGEGNFVSSFGWDVDATEVATEYEVCPAANVCKAGVAGAGAGQVGSTGTPGTMGIAVSQPDGEAAVGKVFLADSQNRRVSTYDLDGANPASFGSATEFGTVQPRKVAVDSRGIVYASDSNTGPQIDRYDSEDANGGGVGFLSSIEVPPLLSGSSATATSGLAVDPDSDEGGADVDSLYVLRDPSSGNTRVQQFDEPGLTAAPTVADEEHGAGAGFTTVNGLGLDDAGGRLFVTAINDIGAGSAHRVYVIADLLPAPVPVMDPITIKTDTTATFSGTIDPQGGHVRGCKFQFATNPDFAAAGAVNEPGCTALDPEGGAQAVSEDVTGLDPNTTYFVRLEVSRTFVPESAVTSAAKAFATDSVPPVVTDVGSVDVADTSARLVGTIDPKNSPTGYVFEYGKTPALGQSTAPLAIGGGAEEITVSRVVTGLSKDTTYYFRLVATNAFGEAASPQTTLHTRVVPLPNPTNRAWEQVTPPDKNYTDADNVAGAQRSYRAAVSADGKTVGYCTTALFGEPSNRMTQLCAAYIAHRRPGGWQTPSDSLPPYCGVDPASSVASARQTATLSPDFSRLVIRQPESLGCEFPLLDPNAPLRAVVPGEQDGTNNLYLQDTTTDPVSYDLLNPALGSLGDTGAERYAGGSDDFGHVVFMTNGNQTPEPDSPAPNQFDKLYDWEREGSGDCNTSGGCLTLLSKDTSNEPIAGIDAGMPTAPESSRFLSSAVSRDGERIFFETPHEASITPNSCAGGCQLYMREGAAVTHDVSATECTLGAACGAHGTKQDNFISAISSGEKAFFGSCARLTDESSPQGPCARFIDVGANEGKLYRWDLSQPPGSRLVDLTVDNEPGDGVQPGLRGLIGHSEDGDTAYFITGGQIVPGQPTGGFEKLYRWRWNGGSPTVDYLGPHDELNGFFVNRLNTEQVNRQVSPDGAHLALFTEIALDPPVDRDSDADLYRWSEEDGWMCASCQLPGVPSAGEVSKEPPRLTGWEALNPAIVSFEPRTIMSDDGQRLFFSTPDALVAADTNGKASCPLDLTSSHHGAGGILGAIFECNDVYEWHDGAVSLVSSGTGSNGPARLISASHSGDAIFFYTAERLVGWDFDENIDIYSARIGGGFPEPAAQPPECEGEGCRGEGSEEPAVVGAGSAVFQGPGNPKATQQGNRACPAGRLRRGKRCLTVAAVARKRCRRLSGAAKRRCVRRQARRLRRAQRRRNRRAQQHKARTARRAANHHRRTSR